MAAENEYQVVARRYRPQKFSELVGQEHIARALSNAIQNNRIGHAYLFTGARGVGKTSTARIFAKSLNCIHGPTSDPCGQCEICEAIAAGEDLDVIEIDGASNRGIDQVRTIIQNVNVRPSRARFKIYIIDEVHMLTDEAFNALLKTLEEPPEHVKFIFCTTEVNKIPITILSRCQRFDFAGISIPEIARRLQLIVDSEGLNAEPEAINLLSRRANGSMRDGQSLLEQLLAFTSGTITLQDVHQLLGTAKDEVLVEILRAVSRNEPAVILRTLDAMFQQGTDPGQLLEQLFGCLRDLMAILAGCGSESFLFLPPDLEEEAREMAGKMGLDVILAAMQVADHTLTRMKVSTQSRLLVEMAFIRICSLQSLVNLADVVTHVQSTDSLKHEPAGMVSSSSPESAGMISSSAAEQKPQIMPPAGVRRSFVEESADAPIKKKELNEAPAQVPPSLQTPPAASASPASFAPSVSAPSVSAQSVPPVSKPAPERFPSRPAQSASIPEPPDGSMDPPEMDLPADAFSVYHSDPAGGGEAPRSGAQPDVQTVWNRFLSALENFPHEHEGTISTLHDLKDVQLSPDGGTVTVIYPSRCAFELHQFQKNPQDVTRLEQMLGLKVKLTVEEADGETFGPPNGGMGLRQKYESPLLSAAEKLFGATIQRVENRKKP
ncbi:MAG: DNA polymerase III subunit gamma/tau [Thermoguttaceae bacterium]|nr:DNA polymerase III subunit gamma/tau [Thermoguttaceae bacterium]